MLGKKRMHTLLLYCYLFAVPVLRSECPHVRLLLGPLGILQMMTSLKLCCWRLRQARKIVISFVSMPF